MRGNGKVRIGLQLADLCSGNVVLMNPVGNDFATYVRKSVVSALEPVCKLEMVQSKLMQHSGMQVIDVYAIFRRVPSYLICFPISKTAIEPAPSQCHAE